MSSNPVLSSVAIVGAGPVGLATALLFARALPAATISVFDSRPADADLSKDRRSLALALGTVQLLARLVNMAALPTEAITHMSVSDAAPLPWPVSSLVTGSALELDAAAEQLPSLGSVVTQGALTAALLAEWQRAAAAEPTRLFTQLGQTVKGYRFVGGRIELDAEVVHTADALVVAEGLAAQALARSREAEGAASGASSARRFFSEPLAANYAQTAWVGTVQLAQPLAGRAVQRFTPSGPLTLLPADAVHGAGMAAIVACVPTASDPFAEPISETATATPPEPNNILRIALLNQWLGDTGATVQAIGYLKPYPLALAAQKSMVNWADGLSGVPRVLHIGAAAQTTYPLLASAIDMGLRDAYELSEKLRESSDLTASLRQWELQRTPERWGLMALTDLAGRTSAADSLPFGGALGGALVGGLRRGALAALNAAGPLKSGIVKQIVFGSRSA